MVSQPQASRGRTVYSGGSYAPTRGQVSAQGSMGYMARERRNNAGVFGGASRTGGDGRSDTRSGVAQRAMIRAGQGKWAGQEGIGGRPVANPGRVGSGNPGQTQQQVQQGIQGTGAPVGGAAQPVAPSPATPTVTVNDSGMLELPYDASWGDDVLGGLQDSNDALLAVQKQQQAAAAQYALNKKMAGEGYIDQQRNTLNTDSGRGMAFSSGHAYNVGSDANNYNNMVNTLDSQYATDNADFDTQRVTIQNAFKNQLRTGALGYADTVDDDAGNLGYGSPGQPGAIGPGTAAGLAKNKGNPYMQTGFGNSGTAWKPPKPAPKPAPPKPPAGKPTPPKPGQTPGNVPNKPGGKKK